ncbi:glyoxylate reductase [Lecanora helva]
MAGQSKPKVLLLGEIEHQEARDSWSSLASIADLIVSNSNSREEFLEECKSGRLNGIRAAYRTFNSVSITGRIEGEVVEALGKAGLKFLSHNGGWAD